MEWIIQRRDEDRRYAAVQIAVSSFGLPQVSAQAVISEQADFYTDGPYDAFAPYWAMSLAVRPEAIKGQFEYIDEKEFPNVKNADPKDFYDNSFVDALTKSGFLKNLGMR